MRAPRIGVVDSGGPPGAMTGARAFHPRGDGPARPDRLGHGSAVAAVLARAAPGAELLHAQVFDATPVTSADRVARAVDWLVPRADIILLSLGLAVDRQVLRAACDRAVAAGVCLVAAAPARAAGTCWPAAYPGVVAATGMRAAIGTSCPGCRVRSWAPGAALPNAGAGMGGASLAAARVAGHLAAGFPGALADPAAWLAARCRFLGPERRRA